MTWHYPYHTVISTNCSRGVACTTPSAAPLSVITPVGYPKPVPRGLSSSHLGATAPYSHGSLGTSIITTSFRSTTLIHEPPTSFVVAPGHSISLPSSPSTPSSVRSKPCFREIIYNLLVHFNLVKQYLLPQPYLTVISLVVQYNNGRLNHCGKQNYLLTLVKSIHSSRRRNVLPLCKFSFLSVRYFSTFYPFCSSFRLHFLLTLVLLNGPRPCFTVTHYSTRLNDQQKSQSPEEALLSFLKIIQSFSKVRAKLECSPRSREY